MDDIQSVRKHLTVYGSISGNYAFRNSKIIWFESTLERDFIRRLEFNDSVLDVVSQPVKIPYLTKLGRESTYTPDMLVTFSSENFYHSEYVPKPILAEIKPNKKLQEDWDTLRLKFKAGTSYAKEQGWVFRIYDEYRIRDQYLENINYLKRFVKGQYNPAILVELSDFLRKVGQCRVSELPAYLWSSDQNILIGIQHTWHLIATKQFSCEMSEPLTNKTIIWCNDTSAKYYGDI